MVEFLQVYLPLVVYILLIVILVVGIIIGLKAIKTLEKVELVVDDVQKKVSSLNGVFSIIDVTTDKLVSFTDKIVDTASNVIKKIFNKRSKKITTKDKYED